MRISFFLVIALPHHAEYSFPNVILALSFDFYVMVKRFLFGQAGLQTQDLLVAFHLFFSLFIASGATTFSVMTLCITTVSIVALDPECFMLSVI
jgi:hypothetical protein